MYHVLCPLSSAPDLLRDWYWITFWFKKLDIRFLFDTTKNVAFLCTRYFHVLKLANTTQKGVPCFTSKVCPKFRRDTHTHTRTLKRPQLASSFPVLKVTNATLFDHFLTLKGGGFPLRTHTHTEASLYIESKNESETGHTHTHNTHNTHPHAEASSFLFSSTLSSV